MAKFGINNFSTLIKTKRLPNELKIIGIGYKNHGITCTPVNDDDFTKLTAIIPGPMGSPYEAGKFKVDIKINDEYPFSPPIIKFITPIFHPNIDKDGNICLDVLKKAPFGTYTNCQTLESILISIKLLLETPNPDHPLEEDIADLYLSNLEEFNKKAREFVELNCNITNGQESEAEQEPEAKQEPEANADAATGVRAAKSLSLLRNTRKTKPKSP